MRYTIRGSDGRTLVVDAADWMMAVSGAIRQWGLEVAGWAAHPVEGGGMEVVDARSGAWWTVTPEGQEPPARAVPRPAPPAGRPERPPLGDDRHRTFFDESEDFSGPPAESAARLSERATTTLRASASAADAWGRAVDLALALVPCEAGSALRSRGETLVFEVARGARSAALIGREVPAGAGIAGAAHALGATLRVDDVSVDHRHFHDLDDEIGFYTRAILASPVRCGGRFFGVVELLNPLGGFTSWHAMVLETVAGALGAWLDAQDPEPKRPVAA